MILPGKLKSGDVVGVIAPSGAFERERLVPGIAYLEAQGFVVKEGDALYEKERYLAGSDEARAEDVNAMFGDEDVKGIFVARGGYGAARVLALVDWEVVRSNPKVLVGLSDTTALQLGMYARTGLVTFSGLALCSDVTEDGINEVTEASLWAAVCEHQFASHGVLTPLRDGVVDGVLMGGCLSLVCSLVGTPFLPDMAGVVLVLEDVNEPPYRVDRMLTQLKMAGVFDQVAGVVFGEFVGCEPEREGEGTLEDVLADFVARVKCPVYCGLKYGHAKERCVLPFGVWGKISNNGLVFETEV